MSEDKVATVKKTDKEMTFKAFATNEQVKLTCDIVRTLIAVPSKSHQLPGDADCIKFMMLCKARRLNPFEGDAFLLGYDGQNGTQWSMITAHQALLKRAEANKQHNGMESGVIVEDADAKMIERQGDFVSANEKLLGGWSKIYRKDIQIPVYKRVKLSTFSTGRSRWEKDAAGMIVKCAEADGLRTAYPTTIGGMYLEQEMGRVEDSVGPLLSATAAGVPQLTAGVPVAPRQPPPQEPETPAEAPATDAGDNPPEDASGDAQEPPTEPEPPVQTPPPQRKGLRKVQTDWKP
jgi:phage recombination protein Bet